MTRHIDRLMELTEGAQLAGQLGDNKGRYARTPDFTRPSAASSRPKSDRGSTFHFAHKAMSKRTDMSDSNKSQTTSASHQGYIERPSAADQITPDIAARIQHAPAPELPDGLISPGFSYPSRLVLPVKASFGTLGTSPSERREFWNDVERSEGRNGRVQGRIIAELPVELSAADRCSAAQIFCQSLEERGLPYWAVIHAPGKRNDKRNYHLHVTYFDRPSGRNSDGTWAHTVTEIKRKKSRHSIKTRPYRSNKHEDTRARDWPKRLRRNYADACNFLLAASQHEKRYDPRPYRESGILKDPTEHLGSKISALETMGLDTVSGQRNAKREIRWKFSRAEQPWKDRQEALVASSAFTEESISSQRDSLLSLISAGTKHARKSVSLDIMSDMIGLRLASRRKFLSTEIQRLERKEDMSDLDVRSARIVALTAEHDFLEDRAPALQTTAVKCAKLSAEQMGLSHQAMKKFDANLKLFDPECVLDTDGLDDMENIDELTGTVETTSPLDRSDLTNIDDLFPSLPASDLQDKTDLEERTTISRNGTSQQVNENLSAAPQENAKEQADAQANEVRKDEPVERISLIVGHLSEVDQDQETDLSVNFGEDAFPGAWSIQPTVQREELEQIDRKLATLTNRQLREAAIASRDATDLCPAGAVRDDFGRGWSVLRFEAGRRGLDLDTGIHDPDRATDDERALLHTDQDPCPIRVIRKNIARQRVRS